MTQAESFLKEILAEQARIKAKGTIERERGNELFKNSQFQEALDAYTEAIKIYKVDAASYANRALCYFKLEEYELVVVDATKALEIDEDYVKAYHRRGKAYMLLQQY